MRASLLVAVGLFLLAGAGACGNDQPSAISGVDSVPGTNAGYAGSQDPFCQDYCGAVVAKPTCEHYNDARHCEQVCDFYRAGACADLYTALAQCNQADPQLSCFLASSGKWGVTISACNAQYDAFNTCITERDAGVCPF